MYNTWFLSPELAVSPTILLLGWSDGHLTFFTSDEALELSPSMKLADHFFSPNLRDRWTRRNDSVYSSVWSRKVIGHKRPQLASIKSERQQALKYGMPYAINFYGDVLDHIITDADNYTDGLVQPVYATPGAMWLIFSQPLCCKSLGKAFAWCPAEHMRSAFRSMLPQNLSILGLNNQDTCLIRVKFINGGKRDWYWSGLYYFDHGLNYRPIQGNDLLTLENAPSCPQHPWLDQNTANRMHFGYPMLPDGYEKNYTTGSDNFGRAIADDITGAYDLKGQAWQLVSKSPRDASKKTSGCVDVHALASKDPAPTCRAYWHQMQLIMLGAMGIFENPSRRGQAGKALLAKMAMDLTLYKPEPLPEVQPEKHYIYDVQGAREARLRDAKAFAFPLACTITWVLSAGMHKVGTRGLGVPPDFYSNVMEASMNGAFPKSDNVSIKASDTTSTAFSGKLVSAALIATLQSGASSRNNLESMDMAYTNAWAYLQNNITQYYYVNNDYVLGIIPTASPYTGWKPTNLQHTFRSRGAPLPHFITYRSMCFTLSSHDNIPPISGIGPGSTWYILTNDYSKSEEARRNGIRLHLMLSEAY